MKKIYLLIFLTSINFICHAQNSLIEKIDQDLKSLQAILKIADGSLRIEVSTGETKFDPQDNSNFEDVRVKKINDDQLEQYFKNLYISASSVMPYSLIIIDKDESDLKRILGKDTFYFMDNPDMEPVYTPLSFTFVDGSTIKASPKNYLDKFLIAEKHKTTYKDDDGTPLQYTDDTNMSEAEKSIWENKTFKDPFLVLDPRPIKSVEFSIKMPVAESKIYVPINNAVNTPLGNIKILNIKGNKVQLIMPETDEKNAIKLQAYYKNGKILSQKGYSSSTYLSPEKRKYYDFYVSILSKAKIEAQSKKLKSEDDLKKFINEEIKAFPKNNSDTINYKSAIFTFSGPVDKVDFIINSSEVENKTFTTGKKFNYENEKYFVAGNFENDKTGIINAKGEWVVKPTLSAYFRPWNKYFFRDQIDDYDETYWLNPKTETLEKTAYKIDDPEIYDGKYVKIEPRVNGLNGLADAFTGKIVLPMEYSSLNFESKTFWVGRLNDEKGVLNKDLKMVLPFKYYTIDTDQNYIYAKVENESDDAFTKTGENITKGKYTDIKGKFSDGLLLVSSSKKDAKNNYTTDYFYIDDKNNVVLDMQTLNYKDQSPFYAGLASVKDDKGDWGFMNTKGKLVIPFQYEYTFPFFRTSNLAEVVFKDNSHALIDKSGKIVKKFPVEIYKREWEDEDRASRLYGKDMIWNEYGEEVEK